MRLVPVQAPLALATFTALLAQQAPPITFKSATHLVQVSVIAQDGKGQPVTDLKKEDFRVRVNGKDQPVKVFSMDSNLALPSSDPKKSDDLLPNTFSNRTAVAPGQKSSTTIILLDARNTVRTDQTYAKAQVIQYLRTLHPGDHIGLYLLGPKALRVLHDYTADSTSLLKHLEALKYKELPNLSLKEPDATAALRHDSALLDALLNDSPTAEIVDQMANKIRGTLKAIEFIANHLAQTPGRKNLIWISGGFPLMLDDGWKLVTFIPEMNETVRAINDANMAIYPVDARGLIGYALYDAASGAAPQQDNHYVGMPPNDPRPIGVANQESMQELASRTGGRAYINTNGLAKAIHDAIGDSLVTYTLGFYPVDDTFDGKFHKIEVDLVDRKDVHLRYRKGFIDLPQLPQDEKTRKRELREAAWSPLDATGIGLTAKVVLSKTKRGALDVALAIDPTQVNLENQSEHWVGRVDVLFVLGDQNGKLYSGFDDTIDIRLNSEHHTKFLKDGLLYNRSVARSDRVLLADAISAKAAPAQHLRIVVRDAATGAIGSITVPLAKVSKDLLTETPVEKTLESRVPTPQAGNIAAKMLAPYSFIGTNMARVNVAIEIPSASLKFEKQDGKLRSTMNILGIAYKEDGSEGARFSDAVKLDFETQKEVEAFQQGPYHYENRLDLGSGKYNLKVIITADGGDFSKLEQPLVVDAYDPKMLSVTLEAPRPLDPALAKIRQRMTFNLDHEPNYTCVETIERSSRPKLGAKMQIVDTLRLEVALIDRREMFAWPGAKKFEDAVSKVVPSGTIDYGNFGTTAKELFTTQVPTFHYLGEEDFQGKKALHFEYKIAQTVSNYLIRSSAANAIVGYHGSFYANPETFNVERIEVIADDLPAALKLSSAAEQIDYAMKRIGDGDFLLPSESALSLVDLQGAENRNHVKFDSCREFAGESVLTFGAAPPSKEEALTPARKFDLPHGWALELMLTKDVNIRKAAIGDPVYARLNRDVHDPNDKKQIILPKGATVTGRIVRMEKQPDFSILVGIEFPDIEAPGILAHMKGFLLNTVPPVRVPRNADLRNPRRPGEGVMWTNPVVLTHGYILFWRS